VGNMVECSESMFKREESHVEKKGGGRELGVKKQRGNPEILGGGPRSLEKPKPAKIGLGNLTAFRKRREGLEGRSFQVLQKKSESL